jgi:hypothetical protein
MKEKSATGIPIFEKKHFWPQNSDIREHIEKVVEGGDSWGDGSEGYEPFSSKGDRSQNMLDPSGDWGQ